MSSTIFRPFRYITRLGIVIVVLVVMSYCWAFTDFHALPVLFLPQIIALVLLGSAIVSILIAIFTRNLFVWQTYIPWGIFVVYTILTLIMIPLWAEVTIIAKLQEPDGGGERWVGGMTGRVLSGFPSPPHCALSNDVAVVVHYWSFVTPDGRMPVLAWSTDGIPRSQLPTRPINCKPIEREWYICELAEPRQLTYDHTGLCNFELR